MAILVVDSEAVVRNVVCHALGQRGYTTLSAAGPGDALRLAAAQMSLQLLLTEVVLPEMPGPDLVDGVLGKFPQTPVLFMSAFSRPEMPPGFPFLQKPFTAQALVAAVESVILRSSGARAGLCAALRTSADLAREALKLGSELNQARFQSEETRRRIREQRERLRGRPGDGAELP